MTISNSATTRTGPPTKHQMAVMIWLAVFPTLTVLNLHSETGSAQ
jgi:antibiotic biosynthesis monooxygenase (ABM) superfamily enzyme